MKKLKVIFVILLVMILFGGCNPPNQIERTTTYPDGRVVVEKPIETPIIYDWYRTYPNQYRYQQPYYRSSHHSYVGFNYSVGKGLKVYSSQPKHHNNKVSHKNNRETKRRVRQR